MPTHPPSSIATALGVDIARLCLLLSPWCSISRCPLTKGITEACPQGFSASWPRHNKVHRLFAIVSSRTNKQLKERLFDRNIRSNAFDVPCENVAQAYQPWCCKLWSEYAVDRFATRLLIRCSSQGGLGGHCCCTQRQSSLGCHSGCAIQPCFTPARCEPPKNDSSQAARAGQQGLLRGFSPVSSLDASNAVSPVKIQQTDGYPSRSLLAPCLGYGRCGFSCNLFKTMSVCDVCLLGLALPHTHVVGSRSRSQA